jgi:hypothetical protein
MNNILFLGKRLYKICGRLDTARRVRVSKRTAVGLSHSYNTLLFHFNRIGPDIINFKVNVPRSLLQGA